MKLTRYLIQRPMRETCSPIFRELREPREIGGGGGGLLRKDGVVTWCGQEGDAYVRREGTLVQNKVILRHKKIHFPTSERTSEWPSTYVLIFD